MLNENDSVATSEIRFGDNDRLAARIATMASADLLILLSDVTGLYTAPPAVDPSARLVAVVPRITAEIEAMAGGAASLLSRGGMRTKIEAGKIATTGGTTMLIADGRVAHPVERLVDGGPCSWFLLALEPGDRAQEMDRRPGRATRHAACRCRRGESHPGRQLAAAGRRAADRGGLQARRLRADPHRGRRDRARPRELLRRQGSADHRASLGPRSSRCSGPLAAPS